MGVREKREEEVLELEVVESKEPPWEEEPRLLEETRSREEGALEEEEDDEEVEDMSESRFERARVGVVRVPVGVLSEEARDRGRAEREVVDWVGEVGSRASETISRPDLATDARMSRLERRGSACLVPEGAPAPFVTFFAAGMGDPETSPETAPSSSPPTPKRDDRNRLPV